MHHIDRNPAFNPSGQDPSSPANFSQPPTKHRSLRRASYFAIAGAIIAALLIGGLVGWLLGQHDPGAKTINPAQQTETEKVAEQFHTAVVQINIQKSPTEAAIGSGVLIDRRGYIVTNNHVIEGGQNI